MALRCRTCLKVLNNGSQYFRLGEDESDHTEALIQCKLKNCVPELYVDIVRNPLMCINCVGLLCDLFKFKKTCMEIDDLIYKYILKQKIKNDKVNIDMVVKWMESNQNLNIAVAADLNVDASDERYEMVINGDSPDNSFNNNTYEESGNKKLGCHIVNSLFGYAIKENCEMFESDDESSAEEKYTNIIHYNSCAPSASFDGQMPSTSNGQSPITLERTKRKPIKKRYDKNIIQYDTKRRRTPTAKRLLNSMGKGHIKKGARNINTISNGLSSCNNETDGDSAELEDVDVLEVDERASGFTCHLEDFSESEYQHKRSTEDNHDKTNESSANKRYTLRSRQNKKGWYNNVRKYKTNANKSQKQRKTNLKHRVYRCRVCDFSCRKKARILHHTQTHTIDPTNPNLPYVCENCDNANNNLFSKYMFNCRGKNTCYFCEFDALSITEVYEHMTSNHSSLCSCVSCNNPENLQDVLKNWFEKNT